MADRRCTPKWRRSLTPAAAIVFLFAAFATTHAAQETIALNVPASVGRYARLEATFQVPGDWQNPFDPDEIAVDAEFTSPSGRKMVVPAFFWHAADPVRNQIAGNGADNSAWKLRFAPEETGTWIVRLHVARRGAKRAQAAIAAFDCVASNRTGFVRASGSYFGTITGGQAETFFPIGVNRCWGDAEHLPDYLREMKALAEQRGNMLRLWLAPWWIPIERSPGYIDQLAAARLDAIVEQAELTGLRLMLCIEQHGNLQPDWGEIALWKSHPYNAAHGGPCNRPTEFFTNSQAKKLFRNRLRYLVARWGYSTSIMSWELFNEVEFAGYGREGFDAYRERVEGWHREMAQFLRQNDPYRHLIATSGDVALQKKLIESNLLDMIQFHLYDRQDVAGLLAQKAAEISQEIQLPLLIGEFGVIDKRTGCEWVSEGILAAAIAGHGAGALPWVQDMKDSTECHAHLKAAHSFFEPVRWRGEPKRIDVAVDSKNGRAHAFALDLGDEIILATWAAEQTRTPVKMKLTLPLEGRFALEQHDFAETRAARRAVVTSNGQHLEFVLEGLSNVAAIRLSRLTE